MEKEERVGTVCDTLGWTDPQDAGSGLRDGIPNEDTDLAYTMPESRRPKGRKGGMGRKTRCTNKWKYRSCGKKKRYRNESDAKRMARLCMRRRPEHRIYCYLCPICNGWHLTRAGWNDRGEKVF